MADHDKHEKVEQKERHEKSKGEKSGTEFHAGEKFSSSDAKGMFAHLTKPVHSAMHPQEGKHAAQEKKAEEKIEFVGPKDKPYLEKNPPLDSQQTADRVANVVRNYEEQGHAKVYTDAEWAQRHQGSLLLGNYIFCEEGNPANKMAMHPIRSGTELDLYDKICKYARSHDITDPAQKISPEMVMAWSLEVNTKDHQVVIQDAYLSAHNVMRALARADAATPENLPADDPVRSIIEDSKRPHHVQGIPDGLPQLMRDKYDLKRVNAETNQDLFDADNKYSVFKPMTNYADSSTGSAYHFWVGALGASTLTSEITAGAVWMEGNQQKHGDRNGRDEQPWGKAGINAYEQVQPQLHWYRWI